jgi:uncharacterized protein DUF7033
MTLVIRMPPSYRVERHYILGVVLGDWLGLEWRAEIHRHADVRIGLDGDDRVVTLPDVMFATDEARWLTTCALPCEPLQWRAVGAAGAGPLSATERLPVLYGSPGREDRPLAELDDTGVRLHVDVFGSAFAMLTRYEEAIPGERDAYQRYPAASALAVRADFLRVPVVDAYVELLRAALHRLWPRLATARRDYRVVLSHDVDDPLSTLGRSRALLARQLAGDVIRRRDLGLLLRRTRALADARRGRLDRDPHNTFDFLMTVSERHGLRSAFYFLSNNDVNPQGGRYDLVDHPWVGRLMRRVHRRGHEIGFHAGLETFRDPKRTAEELAHLRGVAEREGVRQEGWGGRQHYLQWANPITWRNWDEAGLDYDCTLAFSEAIGFRTGTCREYGVFDLGARRPLRLRERPFQVMDVSLFGYMGLRPDAAFAAVVDIARACRRFRGDLGILWHNDEILRTASQQRWYAELIEAVTV